MGSQARREGCVLLDLPLDGRPVASFGLLAKDIQENGLADSAEAGDDHGLFGVAALEALQQDLERIDLTVTADQCRGLVPAPGA